MFLNMKRAKILALGMAICFLLIHIFMFNVFSQCNVVPMARFNIFSIAFYLSMLFIAHKGWLPFYTFAVYTEVAVHMTLAVILTGWGSGFQVTLIGMNVLAFYAEYTGRSLKLKCVPVLPMSIAGMLLYLGSRLYLKYHPAPYDLPAEAELRLSLMWGIIVFVISIFILQLMVIIALSSQSMLEYQLSHDQLTGLPNRYYLSQKFEALKKNNKPYWIAIADIDDFKKINDTYGHECGDYILKTVGEILSSKRVQCCRWGGEEFIFVEEQSDTIPDRFAFLNDLRQVIEDHPFVYEGTELKVTMTFGLAHSSGREQNIDEVIRNADEKLYAGKYGSKNRVVDESNFEYHLKSKKEFFDSNR